MLPKDPVMLASYLNTKLRDEYDSLESLCGDMDVSMEEIAKTLAKAGLAYDESLNQVR